MPAPRETPSRPAADPAAGHGSAAATSRPPRWRRWAVRLGKLALLFLALWLAARLLADLDWRQLQARMEAASRPWLGAALAVLALRFVVWDERWRRAVARVGPVPPRWITLPSLLAAATVNTVTPTARVLGGVMRARHLSRADAGGGRSRGGSGGGSDGSEQRGGMGQAYGSVLYDQLAHQVVIGVLTWLTLIAAAAVSGRPRVAWWLAGAFAVTALAVTVVVRRRGRSAEGEGGGPGWARWLAERVAGRSRDSGEGEGDEGRLRRLVTHGREAVRVVRRLLRDRRLAVEAVVLTLVFFVVNASAQWMVFAALGSEVSFLVVLAVVALGAMAGVAVGTPGGIGGAEAAMIASFTALGVGRLDAAAGALLFRAFHFAVILALGLPSLVWLEVRLGGGSGGGSGGGPSPESAKNDPPK